MRDVVDSGMGMGMALGFASDFAADEGAHALRMRGIHSGSGEREGDVDPAKTDMGFKLKAANAALVRKQPDATPASRLPMLEYKPTAR